MANTPVIVENVSLLPKTAARTAANLLVLQSYPPPPQIFASKRVVQVENPTRVQPWKGSLLVLGTGPNALTADIFIGQDTYGWPVEMFEAPTFPQAWKYNSVIYNSYSTYVFANDRRAKQAVVFYEEDTFFKQWKSSQVLLNTFIPYVPGTDVARAKQALYFTDPEIFFGAQPKNPIVIGGTSALVMPKVVGLSVAAAQALLASFGFLSVSTLNDLLAKGPKGIVSSQSPLPGTGVSVNTPVTIYAPGLMPSLVGLLLQQAEAALKTAGILVPSSIGYFGTGTLRTQQGTFIGAAATWPISVIWVNQQTPTNDVDGLLLPSRPNLVLAQNPAPGTFVIPNSTVTLTVVQPATGTVYPGTNLTSF